MDERIRFLRISKQWSRWMPLTVTSLDLLIEKSPKRNAQWNCHIDIYKAFCFVVNQSGQQLTCFSADKSFLLSEAHTQLLETACPNLTMLTIDRLDIEQVARLQGLEVLTVKELLCESPKQKYFDAVSCLRRLLIYGHRRILSEVVRNLQCSGLREFHVNGQSITNQDLDAFTNNCPCVKELHIVRPSFTNAILLRKLKELEQVRLEYCRNLMGIGEIFAFNARKIVLLELLEAPVVHLAFLQELTNLKSLLLHDCPHIASTAEFEHISAKAPLTQIIVNDSKCDNDQLVEMLISRKYPLSWLAIGPTYDTSAALDVATSTVQRIVLSMPSLTKCGFLGNAIDDSVFDTILQHGGQLCHLHMTSELCTIPGALSFLGGRCRAKARGAALAHLELVLNSSIMSCLEEMSFSVDAANIELGD